MKAIRCVIAAGLLAAISGSAIAKPGGGLNNIDKDYLKATAQSNLEEVQLEPVVQTHAANAESRQFGQRMKRDHAQANAGLKQVAAQIGYRLPKDISEDQQHIMKRLAQFRGSEFDSVYKQEMIHDHTEDIARTEREISLGSNPIVVASAKKNLALLQMHLKMSQALPNGSDKTASR